MNESKDDSFQLDYSLEKRRQNGRVRLLGGDMKVIKSVFFGDSGGTDEK